MRRAETAFILLMAVTVALAMKVVGILLITSLMIFPTAVARPFSKTPKQKAALAGLAAAAAVLGRLYHFLRFGPAAGPSLASPRCSSSSPPPRLPCGAGERAAGPLGFDGLKMASFSPMGL